MYENPERSETPITAIGGYSVHPNKHNLSFGRWAIPVMARRMQDPDPVEKRRAIQAFCDFAFDSKRVSCKEFESVVPALKSVCEDQDVTVRTAAAHCFGSIVATAAGRRAFGKSDFYDCVLRLLTDEEKTVRHAANIVLWRLTLSPMASEELVAADAIPKLIKQVPKEEEETLEILLQTLYSCCLVDPHQVLEHKGLEFAVPLLNSPSTRVREKAANIIKELSVDTPGRNKAIELSAVPMLLNLLDDNDESVQAKALSALMMIVIATPAKFLSMEMNAINKLVPLLRSKNREIRLYSIKILTSLSEVHQGCKILSDQIQTISQYLSDGDEDIERAANKLIAAVTNKYENKNTFMN